MKREYAISGLLHRFLYPTPKPGDPANFPQHLSKYLVPEVRIETQRFYGSLDTVEARYPGLNYTYAPHRRRLGHFPHHAALFQAFDLLGLTETEILSFCRWEGTLWARERYERDEQIKVLDTTGNDIGPWVDKRHTQSQSPCVTEGIEVKTEIEVQVDQMDGLEEAEEVKEPEHADGPAEDDAQMIEPEQNAQSEGEDDEAEDKEDGYPAELLEESGRVGRTPDHILFCRQHGLPYDPTVEDVVNLAGDVFIYGGSGVEAGSAADGHDELRQMLRVAFSGSTDAAGNINPADFRRLLLDQSVH